VPPDARGIPWDEWFWEQMRQLVRDYLARQKSDKTRVWYGEILETNADADARRATRTLHR
jgi:hypothetical protein